MNRRNFISTFLFLDAIFYSVVSAADTIAVVIKSRGSISLVRNKKASDQKVGRGFRLQDSDKLVTQKNSFAAVRFIDDASLVRIRESSTCTILGKKEQNKVSKNIYLEAGTLFARVTQQKGKFEVSTPTSVASVKGTKFIVEQRLDGGTFYYGEEGVIEVSNDAGSALVHADETGYVKDKNTLPVVEPTKPGERPTLGEDEGEIDDFELEFENQSGERKILNFSAQKKE
jgi:hypothetical protein